MLATINLYATKTQAFGAALFTMVYDSVVLKLFHFSEDEFESN